MKKAPVVELKMHEYKFEARPFPLKVNWTQLSEVLIDASLFSGPEFKIARFLSQQRQIEMLKEARLQKFREQMGLED